MKNKILFFLLSVLISATAFSQTDKEGITKIFEAYFKTVEQKNNAKTPDFLYPKLFDHFPKEQLLQLMDRMKADTATEYSMDNASIAKISESLEIDGIKFAVVKYTYTLTMKIMSSEDEAGDTDEKDENPADFTYEMLKEMYGEKNVLYERKNRKFIINMTNEMYAINNPVYNDWKFLEKKENMKPVLEKVLPKKVLKHF